MIFSAHLRPERPRTRSERLRLLAVAVAGALVAVTLLLTARMLGVVAPRAYVVLSMDPAELRPYGGYLGAYGAVVLHNGRVADVAYGDTKDLDDVYDERLATGDIKKAFEPHHLYAPSESPDFPTVASSIADIYAQLTDARPFAIVTLDPAAAGGLLRITGPLQVAGELEAVTEANVLPLVLKHTQQFDEEEDRKQFVYDLGKTLGARLRSLPPTQWPEIVQSLARSADERHIQLYFEDPLLQRLVQWRGWDGGYPPPSDDFLAVVDSNVGYNKANLVTAQALDYRVTIEPSGTATAALTIAYENRGTDGLGFATDAMPYVHEATYDAELQVFVPRGSVRLSPAAPDATWSDLGRTVFGAEVTVPPEERRTVTITYRLPDRRVDGARIPYELTVRKQAGSADVPFRLTVTGPEGWRAGTAGREWSTESTLDRDRQFRVAFER